MDKTFKLYVVNYQPGLTCEKTDGIIGIVAQEEVEAYQYLEEWSMAYGSEDEPGEVLMSMVFEAQVFDIIGDKVNAGINFVHIAHEAY